MIFSLTSNDRIGMYKKMREVLINIKELNEKTIEKGYEFVLSGSIKQIRDCFTIKKVENNMMYTATMYFIQKPVFSYSYHGTINNTETNSKSRCA